MVLNGRIHEFLAEVKLMLARPEFTRTKDGHTDTTQKKKIVNLCLKSWSGYVADKFPKC